MFLALFVCSTMARPKGGGAADDGAAADAAVAAIVEELESSYDEDLVRKVARKMYVTFSGHLDAKAVANKIKAKLAKKGELVPSLPLPILYSYVCISSLHFYLIFIRLHF